MKERMKVAVATILSIAVLSAGAAGTKADKPKPLDAVKNAKFVEQQGGLVMPPDNGSRILVWDATGNAGTAIVDFTNVVKRMMPLPFSVKSGPITGSPYKAAKDAKGEKIPAVLLVSEAGNDAPALSVYPEEAISCINYSALIGGDEKTINTRIEKELFRSLGFALGGYSISRMPCVMDTVFSREDLDENPTMLLSPMRLVGINKAAEKLKLPVMRPTLYSRAVREGWASAPTNDVQRKIWDDVHAIPQKPMKIQFDPAAQKGKISK